MLSWFKNKYNQFFLGFIVSIFILFPSALKEEAPTDKAINADGLGYYAYLPATFIYNDKDYEFKWFNEIYYKYYPFDSFGENNQNFFVKYKNRTINKYYQGLSFLWLPFFLIAHLFAKIFHAEADGFSFPYQVSIAVAALFYLLLGLVFLRKLLQKLFGSPWISLIVPIAFFYGTYLFCYTFSFPSHTHVYSFSFIIMLFYFTHGFFNDENEKWKKILMSIFCFAVVFCIRPLNAVVFFALPAFIPAGFLKEKTHFDKFKPQYLLIVALTAALIIYQFGILYIQTETFLPFTYTNEHFYFYNPKLFFVLFSYHLGLFVYVPLAFLSLFGIFYLHSLKQKIVLPLTFFIVAYLYASWWYWVIAPRAFIDFYGVLAILLAALLKGTEHSQKLKRVFIFLIVLMTLYFQLKNYQVKYHIIDPYYTHKKLFWKNFFRLKPAHTFAVPPSSILKEKSYYEDFERADFSNVKSYSGKYALELNQEKEYTPVLSYTVPDFFKEKGLKKIRFSFWSFYTEDINQVHVIMTLHDKENNQLNYIPFYIKEDFIRYNAWDYEQFGVELSDEELNKVTLLKIYLWNPGRKNAMYLDDAKTEFILTDKSYEIVQ